MDIALSFRASLEKGLTRGFETVDEGGNEVERLRREDFGRFALRGLREFDAFDWHSPRLLNHNTIIMADSETNKLDSEILAFIKKYGSSSSTDDVFGALALKVYRYQYGRNRFYRKYCDLEGQTPETVRGWKEIPAMPVAGFKDLVLTGFPAKNAVKIFRTSGTTCGAQRRGAHLFDTLKLYEAAIVPTFEKFLMPRSGRIDMRFLIAPPNEAPDSSLSFMMGVVRQKFSNCGNFYVKNGEPFFKELAQDLRGLRLKTLILTTAFALKGFLDTLNQQKISLRLPKGSRIMETGGFKGKTREISKVALYRDCRSRLGVPEKNCISEYGMTELSAQFYSRGLSGFFQGPAWARTLVMDPLTGKEAIRGRRGLLRHIDLANRGSVMAIQTEDLGTAGKARTFRLTGRAKGSELRGCSLSYEEFVRQ